jgi:DNA mismatch endonuclease, patch repair protein
VGGGCAWRLAEVGQGRTLGDRSPARDAVQIASRTHPPQNFGSLQRNLSETDRFGVCWVRMARAARFADVPAAVSRRMSRVRSKGTSPEMLVRQLLHRLGYRFRLHRKDLPGTPDLSFVGRRKAIFVHGCFWHAHDCPAGKAPKSRLEYWAPKLQRNVERDQAAKKGLGKLGWDVLTVWQCETKDVDGLVGRLVKFLDAAQGKDENSR